MGAQGPSLIQCNLGTRVSPPNGISFCPTGLAGCTSVTDTRGRGNIYRNRQCRLTTLLDTDDLVFKSVKSASCHWERLAIQWNRVKQFSHYITNDHDIWHRNTKHNMCILRSLTHHATPGQQHLCSSQDDIHLVSENPHAACSATSPCYCIIHSHTQSLYKQIVNYWMYNKAENLTI